MPRSVYDIRALARTIRRRREEYNRLHPDSPAPITSAMSRILENDPDYIPYRTRAKKKRHGPASNPTIATLVEIANSLGTTVGDLLGEQPYVLTPTDRQKLREFVRYLVSRFDL